MSEVSRILSSLEQGDPQAAEAMRHILVDRARRKRSRKRGGDRDRVEYVEANLAAPEAPDELLAVDEALDGLAAVDVQAAEVLGTSPRSADRLWAYARAWLRRAIAGR